MLYALLLKALSLWEKKDDFFFFTIFTMFLSVVCYILMCMDFLQACITLQ